MTEQLKQELEKGVAERLSFVKEQLAPEEIVKLATKLLKIPAVEEVEIPLSVFHNDYLSSLETIVKYLRENLTLSYKQIGSLTNRNPVVLAVTYRNANRKFPSKLVEKISPYKIPVSILKDKKLSVLENIVCYLKDNFSLSYHNIAVLLNRDDRTIWTVYQRAQKKKHAQ
jgi:hypothetical protein